MNAQFADIALDAGALQVGEVALGVLIAAHVAAAVLGEELFGQHALQGAELEMELHSTDAERREEQGDDQAECTWGML